MFRTLGSLGSSHFLALALTLRPVCTELHASHADGVPASPGVTWDVVLSRGAYGKSGSRATFNSKMGTGGGMVKRECSSCSHSDYKLMIYKRTGARPKGHDCAPKQKQKQK